MRKAKLMIGVSGAQGGGKSTLLKAMAELGYNVDPFKVSRAVQAKLGWDSLDRVMSTPKAMMEFQTEVFKQKRANDKMALAADTSGIVLTERTFADLFSYTSLWTHRFVDQEKFQVAEADEFITWYFECCLQAQTELYDGTVLLPLMSHIAWESDPNRASVHDAEQVYNDVQMFVQLLEEPSFTITAESVQDRAQQVQTFIRSL